MFVYLNANNMILSIVYHKFNQQVAYRNNNISHKLDFMAGKDTKKQYADARLKLITHKQS